MPVLEHKLESEMITMSRMVRDTFSGLTEQMNQKLNEVDTKFNILLADLVPTGQNSVNSSVAQHIRHNPDSVEPSIVRSTQPKGDHTQYKMKPQYFNVITDFDEFLSKFEITCEINGWQYREKSLYLASCLTVDARSLSNRSEIYRTQLKSKVKNKGESIPELAQAIKKLVRQAYTGVNKDVIETLAIDNFVDALTDSDIRLRVRQLGPKTLADAERTALR